MKQWLQRDAAIDVLFVIGLVLVVGAVAMISVLHATIVAGLVLMAIATRLRTDR